MQQSIFVGLDLGSSHCHQTVINADGTIIRSRSVPTSEQHLRNSFADLQGDVHVHAEASELAAWSRSIISPLVSRFVISHPPSLAWIAKDPKPEHRRLFPSLTNQDGRSLDKCRINA